MNQLSSSMLRKFVMIGRLLPHTPICLLMHTKLAPAFYCLQRGAGHAGGCLSIDAYQPHLPVHDLLVCSAAQDPLAAASALMPEAAALYRSAGDLSLKEGETIK